VSVARRTPLRLAALLVPVLAVLWAVPSHAADKATIDNAQPTDGAVQLLVTVPGTAEVDLGSVAVTVGGKTVDATAVPAAQSNDVSRTTILAIDTSESMKGTRISEAQKAAGAYLDSVPANVKVGVVTFDDTVKTLVEPGLDRDAARTAIADLTLTRNTALYAGVLGAIKAAGPGGENAGQRKILVLSDGKDTTKTSLDSVLKGIKDSGVTVDVVSLQQGDEGNKPLNDIAIAGKGQVIDTQDPAALSATFASEAGDLARQIVVTAKLPSGSETSANVDVAVTAGGSPYTTAAYVPIRPAGGASDTSAVGPIPVRLSKFAIPQPVVYGGVAALGLGLLGVIALLAMGGKGGQSRREALATQMSAYGASADPSAAAALAPQELSLADQARQAAERALASNRGFEVRIARRLDGAGMAMKPAEWLLMHGGIAVVATFVGGVLGGLGLGLVFLAAGIVGPWVYLGIKRGRRLKAFNTHLADTLQLMSGSLSAGLSLAQSIDTIVREGTEPITSEFKRVVIETRLGVTLEDSLESVAERMESKDFEWVVMAIRIQREVGGNLAELLLTVAATLRERDYLRRHVKALSAEGRLSCYILGGLPPAFLLYLTLSKPDYTKPMYTTPIGWILCAGMAVLLGVGVLWMSKVAKVDV
jgi:tight adherence protein B